MEENLKVKKWFSDNLDKNEFKGSGVKYTLNDIKEISTSIGCEVPALVAVLRVEAAGSAWNKDGTLKMLYEAHIFGRHTKQIFTKSYPHLSASSWAEARKFYLFGSAEYNRFLEAAKLDRAAAFKSASWGLGQIMGFNAEVCGFNNAEEMVFKFVNSERAQLEAMVNFFKSVNYIDNMTRKKKGENLAEAIRNKDWSNVAFGYNGPAFAEHGYHIKLSNAYIKAVREYEDGKLILG